LEHPLSANTASSPGLLLAICSEHDACCCCCVAGGASPSAVVLSGQHSDKLQQLQGSLQGKGGCNVEVEAADATDPEQVTTLG
jgi:hypothetical protein